MGHAPGMMEADCGEKSILKPSRYDSSEYVLHTHIAFSFVSSKQTLFMDVRNAEFSLDSSISDVLEPSMYICASLLFLFFLSNSLLFRLFFFSFGFSSDLDNKQRG